MQRKRAGGIGQVETGGKNLQEKEPTLLYRLQITTIIPTRAGEVAGGDGKRMAERLRDIVATGGILLS